jgi:hypothetical protein
MPLFDDAGNIPTAQITRPGQFDQTGDLNAAAVIEYNTTVEHTIQRASKLAPMIPMRSVRGTNKIGSYGFGKSEVQKLSVGEAPPATPVDIGRNTLTVDTVVLTRHALPLLEVFQTSYDARQELGIEDGTEIAKFTDQAFFIQAAKAAMLTNSTYSSVGGKPAGFKGGNIETLALDADRTDPAKLYQAIRNLFVKFEEKDVVPQMDDLIIALRPAEFYTLMDAEHIVNGDYITAQGNSLTGVPIFKAFGCPVVSSNNIPQSVITGHHLSNANNSNAYDGDFTKLVAQVLSAKALLAGETIPLESDIFYDKILKSWFVDSHLSFGVTPDRAEYAGAIVVA